MIAYLLIVKFKNGGSFEQMYENIPLAKIKIDELIANGREITDTEIKQVFLPEEDVIH